MTRPPAASFPLPPPALAMDELEKIRRFWDDDAPTYDRSPSHRPRSAAERAAWRAALARLLPAPPARVLDVGAGTGFLALMAAGLGHRVTALDLSPRMLEHLGARSAEEGVEIDLVEGSADDPPPGSFDAVIERHLVWTLPDPARAMAAWRKVAPSGRLALFESLWGMTAGRADVLRQRGREALRRARGLPPDHHGAYPLVHQGLPLGEGTPPARLAELVEAAGWGPARLERLRDVEWAAAVGRGTFERLLGETPRFVVIAGS